MVGTAKSTEQICVRVIQQTEPLSKNVLNFDFISVAFVMQISVEKL